MDPDVKQAISHAVETEPLATLFRMRLVDLDTGFSKVEMACAPEQMNNIYRRPHGGAIFALIDEAFETASQTHGTIAVALHVSVTYVTSPDPDAVLEAVAREISCTKKTANYEIRVTDREGNLIATCQALAFRTGKPIPFI